MDPSDSPQVMLLPLDDALDADFYLPFDLGILLISFQNFSFVVAFAFTELVRASDECDLCISGVRVNAFFRPVGAAKPLPFLNSSFFATRSSSPFWNNFSNVFLSLLSPGLPFHRMAPPKHEFLEQDFINNST